MTKEQFVRICNEHGVLAPDLVLEGIYLEVMAAIKKGQGSVVQQLVGAYIDEMKRVRGITPQVDAIVANQLKAVFKETPAERAVELVRAFVNLPDPELAYVHWDLGKFRWSLQKCVAFLDRGIHVTRQQLNHAADPKRDEDAEAVAISSKIIERVSLDGRNNWQRAKERIGDVGWDALGGTRAWHDLCAQLTESNVGTMRAQLREQVKSRLRRGPSPEPRPALPDGNPRKLSDVMSRALAYKKGEPDADR
jgi:hypothetical protein